MSRAGGPASFGSYADFYRGTYPQAITEMRTAGRYGAAMFLLEQGAGDWSDAATPDLVVSRTVRDHGASLIDVGGGRFRVDGVPAGNFLVIPPGFATTFLVDESHGISVLSLPYAKLLALAGEGSGLPADGDFGPLHRGGHRDDEVVTLMDRLWAEGAQGRPRGALWADGALLQVAASLLRLRDRRETGAARGGLAPWQVRRVTDFLDAHLAADTGLVELAGLTGLSTFHFARAFKRSTGLAPGRWRTRRRVERARDLLATTAMSVADVSAAVGYDDPSYFSRAFRRQTGVTPGAFRRERRG